MPGRVIEVLKSQLLPTLDQNERLMLMLFYAEDLSPAEISGVLHLPLDRVRATIDSLRSRTEEILKRDPSPAVA